MKNAVIVHGWGGGPGDALNQWLAGELHERDFSVIVPEMPDSDSPTIEGWVGKLQSIIDPREDTLLIGHSIGCQAILRYLAGLPKDKKISRCIFIAPWLTLNMEAISEEGEESVATAEIWTKTPIDLAAAKAHAVNGIYAIFSDNDPWVPISNKDVLERELVANTIMLHNRGHFTEEDGVTALPEVLDACR